LAAKANIANSAVVRILNFIFIQFIF